jgi:hypothetical protein
MKGYSVLQTKVRLRKDEQSVRMNDSAWLRPGSRSSGHRRHGLTIVAEITRKHTKLTRSTLFPPQHSVLGQCSYDATTCALLCPVRRAVSDPIRRLRLGSISSSLRPRVTPPCASLCKLKLSSFTSPPKVLFFHIPSEQLSLCD